MCEGNEDFLSLQKRRQRKSKSFPEERKISVLPGTLVPWDWFVPPEAA